MDASSSPDFQSLQKPLEHFRAKTKRLKVHPLENALLAVVCAHLTFLPWAIGGMRPWSQFISLGFSLVSFSLALLPRNYTEEHTGSNRFRLIPWPRLAKFPLFWIGLLLLVYITLQALNPAWEYATNGRTRWMNPIAHTAWLPSGVRVPFVRWGPWRMLLIYSSVFLTICSLWAGFTRRRSLQVLFTTIAVNGIALSALGIAQRPGLLGNGKIFWFYESANPAFFASFVYKNHGGAYLFLTLAATCGIAAWYYFRGLRRLEKSNPSGVFAFFATCIAVAILVSYARGVTMAMLVFLCVCILAFVIHQFTTKNENRKPVIAIAMVLVFAFFLKTGLNALNSGEAWSGLAKGITRGDTSLQSRELAADASLEMLSDYWLKGAGSGSFQFLFPIYEVQNPKLYAERAGTFWEHAHNDILEIPIELGAVGMALLLAGALYCASRFIRSYAWENPLSSFVMLGTFLLLVYSWWDLPFQNPAILMTWCVLIVAAMMWAAFEEMNVKG